MNTKIIYGILIASGLIGGYGVSRIVSESFGSKQSPPNTQSQNTVDRGNGSSNKGMGNIQGNGSKENCLSDGCLAVSNLEYPVGTLTDEQVGALQSALDDEYKAYATYDAVIKKLGNVRPFIMIIRAEEQHISSLKALFDKYGLNIPENSYLGSVTFDGTLSDACTTGVEAEIANGMLYQEDLLDKVKGFEDIAMVFTNLMNASNTKHLPAFERCVE